jgi:hypothetical protein
MPIGRNVIITQTGADEPIDLDPSIKAVQHPHSGIHPGWVNHYLKRRAR